MAAGDDGRAGCLTGLGDLTGRRGTRRADVAWRIRPPWRIRDPLGYRILRITLFLRVISRGHGGVRPGQARAVRASGRPRSPDEALSWPDGYGIYQRALVRVERDTDRRAGSGQSHHWSLRPHTPLSGSGKTPPLTHGCDNVHILMCTLSQPRHSRARPAAPAGSTPVTPETAGTARTAGASRPGPGACLSAPPRRADHHEHATSLLSRRVRSPAPMWDPDNTP